MLVSGLILFCLFTVTGGDDIVECLDSNQLETQEAEVDHKICAISREGCIQLTILPEKNRPERRFFGCVEYANFGQPLRDSRVEGWYPRHSVRLNGTEYVGQLMLCMFKDMCNEEIAVTLEGIYEARPMGYDENEDLLSVIVYMILVMLFAYPVIFLFSYLFMLNRRRAHEKNEIGRSVEPMAGHDETLHLKQLTADRFVEDGKIPTLMELQQIYDVMREKRTKERVTYAASTEPRNDAIPIRICATEKMYKASSDMITRISRAGNTRFENLLFEMLCYGPTTLRVKPHNLASLFADLYDILFREPALIELPPAEEYLIIGDLRGEYRDLHRWLRINGYPPTKKLIVLGGMVANENLFSLETFVFLAALKVSMPHDVYLLRGATESLEFQLAQTESWNISNAITTVVSNICERLPVAASIGAKIFCVHSGISPLIKSLSDIQKIDRSTERLEPDKLLCHLIFSEPSSHIEKYEQIKGSRGLYFGPLAVKKFCEDHALSLIIRAHNPTPQGFFAAVDGRLLSLWSTPGYDGCEHSAAALVRTDMSVEIVQMSC